MSADNAIGIKKIGDYWFVKMIFMSEDRFDLSDGIRCESRKAAFDWAQSMVEKTAIVEYGVIDLDAEPPEEGDAYWPRLDREWNWEDDE